MRKQAAALDMDPFDFVYRLLVLKDQELQLAKEDLENARQTAAA
jgi:hypothetical protein